MIASIVRNLMVRNLVKNLNIFKSKALENDYKYSWKFDG
jgi:hypothetical protein